MASPKPNTFTLPLLWGHCEAIPDDGDEMALEKAGYTNGDTDDPRWMLKGMVSAEIVDRDGHILEQDAIDWEPFDMNGVAHESHPFSADRVVGYRKVRRPCLIKSKSTGQEVKGNYLEIKLDPNRQRARDIRDTHRELVKAGGLGYGFSVEGDILQMRGNRITKAVVRSVAVDLHPRNQIAYAMPLAAGSAIVNPGEMLMKAIAQYVDPELSEKVQLAKSIPSSSLRLARFREQVGDLDMPIAQVRDELAKYGVQL